MNPVTVTDLEARWRPLSADEQTVAQAVLEDAWVLLLSRAPAVEARQADGSLAVGAVIAVVSAMALRVLRNPDGYVSQTVGAFSYQRSDSASGGLFVSADELALLSPTGTTVGAFTIRQTAVPTW